MLIQDRCAVQVLTESGWAFVDMAQIEAGDTFRIITPSLTVWRNVAGQATFVAAKAPQINCEIEV